MPTKSPRRRTERAEGKERPVRYAEPLPKEYQR